MAKTNLSDKQLLQKWEEFKKNVIAQTTVISETDGERIKRIAKLEKNPEEWFKYYFPNFYKSDPADFQLRSTRRLMNNAEWYEVRAWSRELAKSTRSLFEFMYLMLTGKKKFLMIASNSYDNAERLFMPFKLTLEVNKRIINDYGVQENPGNWTNGDITTRTGFSIRAIGAGQSPRGAKNDDVRPDIILFDDFDTDEECRNIDIIDNKWAWVNEALMPTRSISEPTLVIWNGNIIAEDCCITRAIEYADHVDVINIRDKHGNSSWPSKNTEEHIDRVLSKIPYSSQQKEYYNNPVSQGKVFKEMVWGKCPPMNKLKFVCAYADPATSNKDRPAMRSKMQNSCKAVFLIGKLDLKYYIYTGYVDVVKNSTFVDWMYQLRKEVPSGVQSYTYIENNSLQDPFYQQVLLPLIFEKGKEEGNMLNITPDTRQKPDKYFRIEGTLEPLNRMGLLIFNIDQKDNPHMKRLEAQFRSVSPNSKTMDGPDAIEGGVQIISTKLFEMTPPKLIHYKRKKNKY